MFGLTFLEPLYLAGLAALPLPILIHLLQRRRARVVEWSSLEFLKPLAKPRTRRLDLRRLLLLALRVLILALLSLALARPSLPGGSPGADAPTTAVIILDCSLSMNARGPDGDKTLFEEARTRVTEVLNLMREGDQATLLLGGHPGSSPPQLTDNIESLREELEEARAGEARLYWPEVLAEAGTLLADSPSANRELYLVSDLQRSGWFETESDENSLRDLAQSLRNNGIRLYPLPVGPLPRNNLSLERVEVAPGRPAEEDSAGGTLVVRARVKNLGEEKATGVGVELLLEDGHSAASVVSVGPDEAVWTNLEATSPAGDFVMGRVEIPPDVLVTDNVRFFAAPRPEPERILLIGRPSPTTPGTLSSHYLRQALDPISGAGPFAVEEVASRDVTPNQVSQARVVILADCERLGPGVMEALERNVSEGGGLMIFVGPGSDLGYLNRTLLPRFLSVELSTPPQPEGRMGEREVAWGSSIGNHPLFRVFGVSPAEAFSRARFRRFLTAEPGEGVSVVASFSDGSPALLEAKRGEGIVLLFTSSPDLSWGTFPRAGNFVPFIHESAGYLSHAGEGVPVEYLVGEAWRREAPALDGDKIRLGAAGLGLTLTDPLGGSIPVVPEMVGRRAVLNPGPLPSAGVYRVNREGELVDAFAANPDSRESEPECLTPPELAELLGHGVTVEEKGASDLAGMVYAARYGKEITSFFLWLAAICLLAEILVRGGFLIPGRAGS